MKDRNHNRQHIHRSDEDNCQGGIRANCSCGWSSPWQDTVQKSNKNWTRHRNDANKAADKLALAVNCRLF
jgi:hypothetical protein